MIEEMADEAERGYDVDQHPWQARRAAIDGVRTFIGRIGTPRSRTEA